MAGRKRDLDGLREAVLRFEPASRGRGSGLTAAASAKYDKRGGGRVRLSLG
ncbi:Hypothetical protein DEACI_1806 [Acididesulfobacillus acetoxydans]|uniref:Uncharacterized protein n=1 Tax=Acididesulfobacillus acetoxydans TaxID=1561005 RepID=A0A8S0VWR7_9FIRM|nr:Hypothetical protein DEACI_1806 [Acididesulfobacillus acetoxydans]CEJ08568.1 Hypothetical protein DEACI_3047 [Acididesulfobacillus acetoxydans]